MAKTTTTAVPTVIQELVERFAEHREAYRRAGYTETQLRQDFLDPFFDAMGWDVKNEQGFAETYRDVILEQALRVEKTVRAPDYCFRIGGTPKFFVEAKKPAVDIKSDINPAFQLRRYAWTAKLPLSILTDFEEFAVYDCRIKPDKDDKASTARVLYFQCTEYVDRWSEIASVFSRDAILRGAFDKFAETNKKKRGTAEVDAAFLEEIESWREALAKNLSARNDALSDRELNSAVQLIIDRIIFLRMCEGRGIEDYGRLQSLLDGERVYPRLVGMFRRADEKYNSGLFHFQKEKGREDPDELTALLAIDDKVLKEIVRRLYYPESPYEFAALPADILGQVYEQFLGKVIRLTAGHRAKIEEKPEVRKAGGVYYTPTYIVDYIVENTVGKLVAGKTAQQVGGLTATFKQSKNVVPLSVLDPACGSGSFLIVAYQYLLDWYLKQYTEVDKPEKHSRGANPQIYETATGDWRLTIDERKRILLAHIFGVDIDYQACEVTKLSLLLKALEGETKATIDRLLFHKERALPDLANNIKCGNSLIGPDYQQEMFDNAELQRVNAFDWTLEYRAIVRTGGFDAVVGNPPWGATLNLHDKKYLAAKYKSFLGNHDSYLFFIEKACDLVCDKGLVSYVTPDSWLKVPQSRRLREIILATMSVLTLTILPQRVFRRVSANCMIFLVQKGRESQRCGIRILNPKADLASLATGHFDSSYEIKVAHWRASSDKQFQIFQNEETIALINKVKSAGRPADNYLDVMQGIVPYSIENHSAATIEGRSFHAKNPHTDEFGPWIKGRGMGRYGVQFDAHEYLKYGPWLHRPRKPKYFSGPRILIQEITGGHPPRICACYCDSRLYHDPGIISCLVTGELEIKYLLGLLNSTLMSWYHRFSSPKGIRHTFPKVLIGDIRSFPIRNNFDNAMDNRRKARVVYLVGQMFDLHVQLAKVKTDHERTPIERRIEATDREIDRLVYELYCLTNEEIELVEETTAK